MIIATCHWPSILTVGRDYKTAQRLKNEQDQLSQQHTALQASLEEERQKAAKCSRLQKDLQGLVDELQRQYLQAEEECGTAS